MVYNAFTTNLTARLVYSIIYGYTVLFCLTGCSPQDYKNKADKEVDNIIDQKWRDSFGGKANYKISDTQPSENDIEIKKAIPASGVLTLPQAVAIATAHNRQYQTEKELLYINALDLRLARHAFKPQLSGGAKGEYAKYSGNEAVGTQADLGFEQLLAGGAKISTDVTAAWVEILTGNMRGGLISLLSTTITQPLLRGSNSRIVLENLTQAERDTVYQIRLFNRFRKMFVVSIASQYYRVLQLHDKTKNAKNNYNALSDVYEHTKKLDRAGRLPRFELDQARQDKLDASDTYIEAQKDYEQALDEFKISLSLPANIEFQLDENELTALNMPGPNNPDLPKINEAKKEQAKEDLTIEALTLLKNELNKLEINSGSSNNIEGHPHQNESDLSEADMIKTALILRLDLANKGDAVIDGERKVAVAADNLRAGLNLVASTDFVSRGNTDFALLETSRNAIGVGLELDLPLDRMAEANEYRKALITLTQRKRDYDETVDTITLEIRRAYRDLTEATERHHIQLESLALAKKRSKNTFQLLQYKRANTRDVLDAQDDLFDAQNATTDALVDHAIAMLSFYRDVGALQVRPNGMWEWEERKNSEFRIQKTEEIEQKITKEKKKKTEFRIQKKKKRKEGNKEEDRRNVEKMNVESRLVGKHSTSNKEKCVW